MELLGDCVIGLLIYIGAVSVIAFLGIALGWWVPYTPNDG